VEEEQGCAWRRKKMKSQKGHFVWSMNMQEENIEVQKEEVLINHATSPLEKERWARPTST